MDIITKSAQGVNSSKGLLEDSDHSISEQIYIYTVDLKQTRSF